MLFMTVFSYEPAQRNEVVRRRIEQGFHVPKTMKVLGEWSYLGAGRIFTLIEATEPGDMVKTSSAWTDLGTLEVLPVLEVEKVLPYVADMVAATTTH